MDLSISSEHLLNATSTISPQNRPLCEYEEDPLPVQVVTAEGETLSKTIEQIVIIPVFEELLRAGNSYMPVGVNSLNNQGLSAWEWDHLHERHVAELLRAGNSYMPVGVNSLNNQGLSPWEWDHLHERPVAELLRARNSYMPVGVNSLNCQGLSAWEWDHLHERAVAELLRAGNSYMPVGVNSLNSQGLSAWEWDHLQRAVALRELLRAGNSYMPVGVNSLNNQGLNAWEWDPLHREGRAGTPLEERDVTVALLPDNSTREMKTLLEMLAVTVTPLPPPPGGVHWNEKQAQVAVMVVFAATSFGIVCNIPTSVSTGDAGGIVFEGADALTGHSPRLLYLVVFNTVVLGFSLGATVKEMWKFPFKPVLLFVSITSCFVYALLVDRVIPKFWVRIGSLNVVSSAMVWLLSGAYVASYYAVRYGFSYLNRLIMPLISKTKRGLCFRGNGNNILPLTA